MRTSPDHPGSEPGCVGASLSGAPPQPQGPRPRSPSVASWGRGSSGVTASWGLSGESLPQHPLLGLSDASSCGWVLRTPPEAPHACPGEERISAKWLWANDFSLHLQCQALCWEVMLEYDEKPGPSCLWAVNSAFNFKN